MSDLSEIVGAWAYALGTEWLPLGPVLLVSPFLAALAWRRADERTRATVGRWLPIAALALSIAVGVGLVLARASVVDDAYVSFRYSRNLLEGHGLVYNVGDRVEGYTNFLWTLYVALGMALTGIDAPFVALAGCVAAFAANVGLTWAIGRRLAAGAPYVPLAASLLAVQHTFVMFGTSGLETGAATTLLLAALWVSFDPGPRNAAGAGLLCALGVLTRPDHAVFYAALGLALLVRRRSVRDLVAFCAPGVLVLAHAAWRYQYYGDFAPNTYYAKSADLTYWSQGIVYVATFWLGSQLWIVALLTLGWVAVPARTDPARLYKAFVVPALGVYVVYVMKVGGDFMMGRFFVVVVPIVLLAAEDLARTLLLRGARIRLGSAVRLPSGLLVAGLLLATAGGGSLVEPRTIRWFQADEGTVYQVGDWSPFTIAHGSFRVGNAFRDLFTERGLHPVIATSGIGMVGYYSDLPLVDMRGLTDRTVAHQVLKKRGHPGHEKWPTAEYLRERRVNFVRMPFHGADRAAVTELRFDRDVGKAWHVWIYDRALMDTLARTSPEIRFVDFPRWLDGYLARIATVPLAQRREDLAFFRVYYFDWNDDPVRLQALEAASG